MMMKLFVFLVLLDWFFCFVRGFKRHDRLYWIPLAVAAISAIPAVIGLFQGNKQRKEAKRIAAENQRPELTEPKYLTESIQRTRDLPIYRRMPGQSATEERIGATTAGGVRAIGESAGGSAEALAAISALFGGEQEQMRDIGIQSNLNVMNQEINKEKALIGLLSGTGANFQMNQFDVNRMQPYSQAAAAASALLGAGMYNQNQSLQSLARIGAGAVDAYGNGAARKTSTDVATTDYNTDSDAPTSTKTQGNYSDIYPQGYSDPMYDEMNKYKSGRFGYY